MSKTFGTNKAVDNVSFDIPEGKIYGILGPNGAGKTTTIRMINHIMVPDSGQILVNGKIASPETQREIGYMPEERGLYKKMKVGEQLLYLAQLKGLDIATARKSISYWLERFEAKTWAKKEIGELSKGMQQKIQFIATVAHDPEIFIFDEPFSGLDPINSELLRDVILELKSRGKTILFSTHRMEQVEQMCDYICLYKEGKNVLQGDLGEIKRSFGKNTVVLEFEGDSSFLDTIQNVRFLNRSNRFAEIVPDVGVDPKSILESAMQHVTIIRYELVLPSLQEIFIQTVKKESVTV
ncbi:MAG: ATP-binding cassette domain-containing protein [Balneolales bacterium]|nr:ATP-binding cassette domain-containing protein [Balneolales bacterium]